MPYAKKICGIYKIFTPSGNCYVGSSYNIFGRLAEHRMHLKNGTHHSSRLQAAWDKHGGRLTESREAEDPRRVAMYDAMEGLEAAIAKRKGGA